METALLLGRRRGGTNRSSLIFQAKRKRIRTRPGFELKTNEYRGGAHGPSDILVGGQTSVQKVHDAKRYEGLIPRKTKGTTHQTLKKEKKGKNGVEGLRAGINALR